MSVDFAALTAAVGAGLPEVRACLIVSRDGLALGSFPPAEEAGAMERWMRLASLGDVEKGFAVVGEECWVFCSRGPYAGLAVAKASARPGLILERLDQMVLAVEEARLRKEGLGAQAPRDAAAMTAAARRRRPSPPPPGVHPQAQQPARPGDRVDVRMPGTADPGAVRSAPPGASSQASQPRPAESREGRPQGADPPKRPEGNEDEKSVAPSQRTLWVMDADDLTREFAGLIDEPEEPGKY
jgi:hypothetical protein